MQKSKPSHLRCSHAPAASLHCHHPARCPLEQYGELVRSSGLPAAQLRAALLVLIQHNYVNCYLKEEPPTLRGPGPSYHVYEAALPRILQSLRWVQWSARSASLERIGCLGWQSGHRARYSLPTQPNAFLGELLGGVLKASNPLGCFCNGMCEFHSARCSSLAPGHRKSNKP